MSTTCLACSKIVVRKKYCNSKCQHDFQYKKYIRLWKLGMRTGLRGTQTQNYSGHIIRYMHETYGEACTLCGWNKKHPITHRVPLEIDHIDGNAANTTVTNLRLVCPNCHALTPNFRNLNRGNGRLWRREKYDKIIDVPL